MRDRAEIRQISRMVRRILTPYPHCLARSLYFLAIHALAATRSAPSECIFCAGSYLPDNMFAPKMRLSNGSLGVCARAFVICAQFGGKLGEIADRNDDDFPDSLPPPPRSVIFKTPWICVRKHLFNFAGRQIRRLYIPRCVRSFSLLLPGLCRNIMNG